MYILPPYTHKCKCVHAGNVFVSNNNRYTVVSKQIFGALLSLFPSCALDKWIVYGNIAREAVCGEGQTFTFISQHHC